MTKALALDIAERAAMTALEAGLAVLLANAAGMTDIATLKAAALAALAAGLSAVKGALASRVGDTSSAALLPGPPG